MTTHRRHRALIVFLIIVTLSVLTGCDILFQAEEDDPASDDSRSRLTITGSLGGSASGSVAPASLTAAQVDLSQIEQVMLFSGQSFEVVDVDDGGNFSIPVTDLQTSGILLVGPDQSFGGVLAFNGTETSMPLHMADDELTTMNLGELQEGSDAAGTSYDVDEALDLSAEERAAFSAASDFFESVMRNPDIDNNGVVDPLEDLYIEGTFNINIQDWTIPAGALTPNIASVSVKSTNPYINIIHPTEGSDIYNYSTSITFPNDSTINGEKAGEAYKFGSQDGLPAAGAYSFSLPDAGISFDYELSQGVADGAFVYAVVPTMVLNDDGTINKVTWQVVDTDMNPVDRAPLMVDYIYIGFDVSEEDAGDYGLTDGSIQVYDTGNMEPTRTEHIFENQNIQWSDISGMYTSTTDLFGNRYETQISVGHAEDSDSSDSETVDPVE